MSEEKVREVSVGIEPKKEKKLSKREQRALQFRSAVKNAKINNDSTTAITASETQPQASDFEDENEDNNDKEKLSKKRKFGKNEKKMTAEEYAFVKKERKEAKESAKREVAEARKKRKIQPDEQPQEEGPKLSKKQRKERNKEIAAQQLAQKEKKQQQQQQAKDLISNNAARFILFLGNLPYSATITSLSEHLKASNPDLIRLPTDKQTKKVKGFAFAEFVGEDASKRMKICLRLHHTEFEGRKINVELTAGGGGNKSENRLQKLRMKNEKLEEERREIGAESRKKETAKQHLKAVETPSAGLVHPSRMAQVTN
ncbi:uncharacterized protein V2V93DRAFT_374599 [Kockiozyma suomiensis]|uniref:uncharacterized protein n=1 Tax=Kockiozyma suomiensis TaxID=1337062 RepID=UPI003343433E